MRKHSYVAWQLIVLILASSACGSQTPVSPSATRPQAPTNTSAPVFTSAPLYTSTATMPVTVSTSTPVASPTPFGGSGKIVYVSCDYETVSQDDMVFERTDNDSCEIYVMSADGRDRVNLTNNEVWDSDPAPSPDGTRIAYVSGIGNGAEIYVMNADGSGKIQLTEDRDWDREPAWSPDGTRLIFVSVRRREISEIRIMNADGGDSIVLAKFATSSDGNVLSPAWSPRGTQIAFVREGFNQTECQGCSAIFVMNADGSNQTQITQGGSSYSPVWSVDGTKIMYAGNGGIFTIYPDGSSQTNVTETRRQHLHANWSPDGRAIVFQSDQAEFMVSEFDIYIVDADGSGLKRLTHNRNSSSPVWLPLSSNPLVSHPDCAAGWSRLEAGDQARVSQETTTPNRVRAGPTTTDAIVTLLDPGTVVKVIEGPVCAEGLIFWRVEHNSIPGGAGWTAEGDGGEFWLEPYVP